MSTYDGLSVTFQSDGSVKGLSVDGKEYGLKETVEMWEILGEGSGFFIEDVNRGEVSRLLGRLETCDNGVRLQASLNSMNITLDATFLSRGSHIAVDGELSSSFLKPRSINLYFKPPVGAKSWIWWDDIESRREIEDGETYETEIYPFACINHGKVGISMAIPPDKPCIFKFGYNPIALFHICFRFGLHPQSKLGSKAPFHLIIYRSDPKWGLRHTAKRYYTFFKPFFGRRALKNGLWLLTHYPSYPPFDQFPGLSDYFAYHETHYPEHGPVDEELGIDTFKYIIPGQREVMYLPSLPSNYEECIGGGVLGSGSRCGRGNNNRMR